MRDSADDPLQQYRQVNTHMTLELARSAARQGVKRFIFLSSIKVNGETSQTGRPFQPDDEYIPDDPYGLSKYEAEQGLLEISRETGMESVIIRPPLVYGPGVKANFLELLKIVNKETRLPLANIQNRRSFIYVENLLDAVVMCIENPAAAGQTYFVSDDEDVSTPELVRRIAEAFGKPARLFRFPANLMRLAGFVVGKSSTVSRLLDSLVVDISKIRNELNWQPCCNMREGLTATAKWFLKVHA